MFCSNCGHNLANIQGNFCPNCGSTINRNPENPKASPGYPKNDGESIRHQIPLADKPPGRKAGKKLKAALIAFILVLGLGVGGFFLWEPITLAIFAPEGEFSQEALGSLTENNLYDSITATAQQEAPTPTPTAPGVTTPSSDDIIEFGGIDWRVLDRQEGRVLVISEYILELRAYHIVPNVGITWADSSIRQYLNSEFLNSFTAEERNRIIETRVINNNNPWFDIAGGPDTTDYVFLLSLDEVVRYFGDSGQLGNQNHPDNYFYGFSDIFNQERIAHELNGAARWRWWLRSPGFSFDLDYYSAIPAFIDTDGSVVVFGGYRAYFDLGVRPALWLNLYYEYTGEEDLFEDEDYQLNNENDEYVDILRQGFVLPFSNTRLLTEDDLLHLSNEELRIARNEIFARHGRRFVDTALQAHFDAMDWYTPLLTMGEEPVLSDLELANATFIQVFESEHTTDRRTDLLGDWIGSFDAGTRVWGLEVSVQRVGAEYQATVLYFDDVHARTNLIAHYLADVRFNNATNEFELVFTHVYLIPSGWSADVVLYGTIDGNMFSGRFSTVGTAMLTRVPR